MESWRHTDKFGTVWTLAGHESAVSSMIMAVRTDDWPRELYAVHDLVAELWTRDTRHVLTNLAPGFAVRAYSSPDVVGVIVEAESDEPGWSIDLLQQLALRPVEVPPEIPPGALNAAISRASRSASEISALSMWAPTGHRYSVPLQERIARIQVADSASCRHRLVQSSKVVAVVGRRVAPPGWARPADSLTPTEEQGLVTGLEGDTVSVVHAPSAELAQVAIVTPGVAMHSSLKGDLHVLWALLREREGVFYPVARSRNGLFYSVAAFSREYRAGGVGMCVVSCPPTHVNEVVQSAREAVALIAAGRIPPASVKNATELVTTARGLAMRNPLALAKALLASEVSGVPPTDYVAQLNRVTRESVATATHQTVHDPGWKIRVTLP